MHRGKKNYMRNRTPRPARTPLNTHAVVPAMESADNQLRCLTQNSWQKYVENYGRDDALLHYTTI